MTAPDHTLKPFKKTTCTNGGIHTCANRVRDSSLESSVVAEGNELTYPPGYKTRNWPAYNEALKRLGSLTIRWPVGDCLQSP